MKTQITVDRFEENKAVLKTNDGQTIIWPKNNLPENINEGMILVFDINSDKDAEERNNKLAKDILNEILNPLRQPADDGKE